MFVFLMYFGSNLSYILIIVLSKIEKSTITLYNFYFYLKGMGKEMLQYT